MTLQQNLRYQKNKELLEQLAKLVEQHPDLRFSQLLYVYGFVKGVRPANPNLGIEWQNEFYSEPSDILKRVAQRVEDIDKQSSSATNKK